VFYDVLTTTAIRDELRQKILGGKVQKVLRLSAHALGCEIYAHSSRHWLLISTHPQDARIHLADERLARGTEDASPLLLLLRKHVRDGRLASIDQPPLERMLVLGFAKQSDEPDSGGSESKLIIEVMGRYSNVILTDEREIIRDSLKRVPTGVNRHRVILPHHQYVPPPGQHKLPPQALTADLLLDALRALAKDAPLWQGLVAAIAGMSPLLGRELAFRALGDALCAAAGIGAPEAARVVEITQTMFSAIGGGQSAPSIARDGAEIIAFAPYLLTHLPNHEPCESMSAAIEAYYQASSRHTAADQRRRQVATQVSAIRTKHERRRASLEQALTQGRQAERLRRSGQEILARISDIAPGQELLVIDGFEIALDPLVGPVENAQGYFRDYKKAKGALQQVPAMVSEEDAALRYLDEVATQLELAATPDEVRRVALDLQARALGPAVELPKPNLKKTKRPDRPKPARKAGPPPHRVMSGGFEVYVGRSATQNDEITFHVAGPEDLWFHARGVPGAHVVVRAHGRVVPQEVVLVAARLAAAYCQARASNRIEVDYTERKHVRRARAGLPGLVDYSDEHTLLVSPEEPR
jgi:predicted ribosome quality control (RQC) complex YloA/Tae2 family protein